MKQEITHSIANVLSNPLGAKVVVSATVASGLVEYLDIFRSGVSLAAVIIGAMVSMAIWRKTKSDKKAKDLEIEMMEYEFRMMKVRDSNQYGRREDDEECQGNG